MTPLSYPVINILSQNLDLEDLNNFRIANRLTKLECQFQISDPDEHIQSFNGLTEQTYHLTQQIKKFGSYKILVVSSEKETTKLLLQSGARVNFVKPYDNTPLMSACMQVKLEIVQLLLDFGADVNLKTNAIGYPTPLSIACRNGNLEIVKLLLEYGAKVNDKNGKGETSLMLASRGGKFKTVKLLLEAGANVNDTNNQGETALTIAKENGHLETVKLLEQ